MNKIDSLRKKRNMSYGDIAKETGLTSTYIYMLAKDKRTNPSLNVMKKIAAVFDKNIEDIFCLDARERGASSE